MCRFHANTTQLRRDLSACGLGYFQSGPGACPAWPAMDTRNKEMKVVLSPVEEFIV